MLVPLRRQLTMNQVSKRAGPYYPTHLSLEKRNQHKSRTENLVNKKVKLSSKQAF